MNEIKLYIDEDAMDSDLTAALRSRGVDTVTPLDIGSREQPDQDQLDFATRTGRVLYTFNISDFFQLHTEWAASEREHAGIILAPQQRFSVGEQLRRILRLLASLTAERMRNRVEFLSRWG